ncbi:DUF2147 domain-containing protein [Microbulbifer sp. EKSA008]|uniref:DUF2147 domain-containing protein n=1 Tax=unclassified Microbulbifer TaxID=2619833 RepID=UPI000D52BF62|nr:MULTISPECIES: DUF2147 domain-containing protein [unclassified Microbulbifer]AWF82819.1 DUF2147 domain-containing protein [Microbulbifer sp. A4B17]WHI45443.1 DUF2147 domain-containing protein [Microbulbifer sp. VAAF005]WNZ55846.1 DUF2147 domain-containing protein [Microbulbifer sp. MKSA007]
MIRNLLLATFGLLFALQASAADILGNWRTIDDETGETKSIVNIYEKDGKYYGKVVDLLMKPNDTVCDKCPGDLKGKPIVGMDVISGLEKKGKKYEDGEILDPVKGKVYDLKVWLEDDNTLKLRGYLGFLYRTQTWHRVQ